MRMLFITLAAALVLSTGCTTLRPVLSVYAEAGGEPHDPAAHVALRIDPIAGTSSVTTER